MSQFQQPAFESPTIGNGEAKHSTSRAAAPIAALAVMMLLLALLLYALSFGPLVWLESRSWIKVEEDSWVVTFYMPLIVTANSCQPIKNAMIWYLSLWDTPTPSIPPPVMPTPAPAVAPVATAPTPPSTPPPATAPPVAP